MAKCILWTEEQRKIMREWTRGRPKVVRDMIRKLPMDRLYRLKSSGHRVTLYSYSEDGTVTVNVLSVWNPETPLLSERRVFGIDPKDLEECELPMNIEEPTAGSC